MKTGTKYDHDNDNVQMALGISDERGAILRDAMAKECRKALFGSGFSSYSQMIANLIKVCETVDEVGYACFLTARGMADVTKAIDAR